MAVIITNMDMPKSCRECILMDGENGLCDYSQLIKIHWDEEDGRPSDCPLKEVPSGENIMIINKDKLHCDCSWDYEEDYYTAYSMYAIEAAQVEEQQGENT